MEFHAHIYYDHTCREQAVGLQSALRHYFGYFAVIHELVDQRRGPHLWPMFEMVFDEDVLAPVTSYLEHHHGKLPVLVHPQTNDPLTDYLQRARWLGQELPLDWCRL